MKVSYCSKTDLGTKHPVNSDALGDKHTKNGHVFVVADGNPVDQHGAYVSKLAVQSIFDFFDNERFDNIYIGINHAFQYANEQVYRETLTNNDLNGVHVSLALVVINSEGAYWGYIGNSKIALQSDDQLTLLTKDHGYLEVQSLNNGSNSSIIKAIGNTPSINPTICNSPILGKKGDVILLATNGVFKTYNLNQLNESFEYQTINKDVVNLVDKAKGQGISENLTLQLIAVTDGNEQIIINQSKNVYSQSVDNIDNELKNEMFNLAGVNRKKMIQIGSVIIALFLLIWFVFRSPKDDTDIVLDDAGEIVKADTTNPHQDLESIMEYDNPQDKEETEEEVVEEELEEESNKEEVETKKTTDDAPETINEDIVLDDTENTNENAPIAETPVQEVKTEKKKETKKKEIKKKETKEKEVKKSKGGSYKVKSGDNLGKIAEKYHIKVEALKKANNIKEDQINVGQDLKIPN